MAALKKTILLVMVMLSFQIASAQMLSMKQLLHGDFTFENLQKMNYRYYSENARFLCFVRDCTLDEADRLPSMQNVKSKNASAVIIREYGGVEDGRVGMMGAIMYFIGDDLAQTVVNQLKELGYKKSVKRGVTESGGFYWEFLYRGSGDWLGEVYLFKEGDVYELSFYWA